MFHNISLQRNIPYIAEDGDHEAVPCEDSDMPNEDDSGEEDGVAWCLDLIDNFFWWMLLHHVVFIWTFQSWELQIYGAVSKYKGNLGWSWENQTQNLDVQILYQGNLHCDWMGELKITLDLFSVVYWQ